MDSRHWHARAAALPAALLVLGFYGCAKRPSIAQLSAPPPSGTAGAGIASGEAGGQNGVSTGANEGAGHGGAGLTTRYAAPRAGRPIARAAATTAGLTSAGPRSQTAQKVTAGASAPGVANVVGGGLPGEGAARAASNGSAANGSATGGPEAVEPGGARGTAAPSPTGTIVAGPGGVGAAGQTGAALQAAVRPAPSSYSEVPELQDIHFDFDRYVIRPDDTKTLDADAGWLRANPRAVLLIEGHCDERGTNEYNLALGQHRAKATLDYLIGQGIAATRITTISYGEERPRCTEHTEECWAKNRRAHFLVKAE
jgi:peptidoglycan-associated lipoprotein